MSEIVKRLTPKKDTLREIFLKSGNLCAFPNCQSLMMDRDGSFIGQICHIEAAEAGGPRFNPNMTNESRRRASNLMLLCYEHHVKTNDVSKYTVDVLTVMKSEHEERFIGAENAIYSSLVDSTTIVGSTLPYNLKAINKAMDWQLDDGQLLESLPELIEFIKLLDKIPISVRQFCFQVAARYCRISGANSSGSYSENISVYALDFRDAFNISEEIIREKCSQMESYALGYLDVEPYHENEAQIILRSLKSGWKIWSDIAMFCLENEHELAKIWRDLDFSTLDEPQQGLTS